MPATDYQGSFLGRISIRRNQVMSMEGNHEQELEDIELFQKHVADRFAELAPPEPSDETLTNPLLSIAWVRKLLDVFLCCDAEFKGILIMGRRDPSQISKPPLDRLIPEMLDRSVKALDICNAITNGIEAVRHYQKLAQIAVSALERKPFGDGQVKRARKALTSLITSMACEHRDGTNYTRAWSFGRRGAAAAAAGTKSTGQLRSLSWSVGKNWSAAKQVHAMSANLVAPRGAEASGLALPVYIMSSVLVFVMWAMVAAIPCQERSGLATHFPVPKQLVWAQSMIGLHEKIGEEWKKKEKKGSAGLLEEMQRLDKLGQSLIEFTDSFQFPAEDERAEEVSAHLAELAETCRRMEEGLVPLQVQIREVFHRIVRSRAEFLEVLDLNGKPSAPAM